MNKLPRMALYFTSSVHAKPCDKMVKEYEHDSVNP
jgi:hypothetical protein